MFKKFKLTLGFIVISLASFAQVQWRQLPPNPNLAGGTISGYDVAVEDGGTFYVVYNLLNVSTGYYDVYFDYYNAEDGWQNLLVYGTTNNSTIDVKTIRSATNIYAAVNTNNANQVTLFQIGGLSAYQLLSQNFTGFAATAKWDLFPGVSNGELYLMFSYGSTHSVQEFDYGTQAWYNRGNPFSASGITPTDFKLYVNQDSVFVAGKYTAAPSDKIKLAAAAKGTWSWNNYSLPNGDVYALNGGVADTVTGTDKFFLFGDQDNTLKFLAKDNGAEKEIPVGTGSYGEGVAFGLDYDAKPDMTTSSVQPYFMTKAANLANQNVVYTRDWATGTWSQFGATEFAPTATVTDSKCIQAAPSSERIFLGYVNTAATPDDYVLMLSNNAPTVADPGQDFPLLCANTYTQGLSAMLIEDLDGDYISFLSASSTDNSLIDPASISVSVFNNGFSPAEIYADVQTGNVVSPQNVTVTYNFTDGFDQLQHSVTYQIVPEPVAAWTVSDTLRFCNNADIVDLYDYVTPFGGDFSEDEVDFPGSLWDPSLVNDPTNFSFDVYYTVDNGACSSTAMVTIASWEAPSAVIAATPSTNCTSNDGTASLDISGGTSPYTFIWNVGNYTDTDLFNLDAGAIHADVTDANGCSTVADAIVGNSGASITATVTPVSCYGAGDGAIDLTVSGLATPLVVLWSNGYSTEDVSSLQPGMHEVWITDASGCSVTQVFEVTEPEELRLSLYSNGTSCGLSEGEVYINYVDGGTFPYTYLWSNSSTADSLADMPSGVYDLTLTDANGCQVTASGTVYDFNAPYMYEPDVVEANCNMNDGEIHAYMVEQGTNAQIVWSNGETDLNLTNLSPGIYTAHLFNDEGCHDYAQIEVKVKAPDRQPICVVTVDSTTSTNLLVWEKLGDNAIDHFNIYRETVMPGQFQLIDTVQNTNLSIFNDVVASPLARSWKYRITAVNECSVESIPSIAHKTIHLTTLDLGNGDFKVIWNFYEGLSYTTFNVYRFTTSTGWQPASTTPASQPYFIDTPPNTVGLDYMVDFELADFCTADVTRAQDFNSARSNKDKGQFSPGDGTGDSNNGLIETNIGSGTVYLYPNPATGEQVYVQLLNLASADYTIVSVAGQEVASGSIAEGTSAIGLQELRTGLYIMHLFGDNAHTSLRFVVE